MVTVRLVGGLTAAEGRVEVNYEGTWGTVCNDSYWNLNDAMVVCRMLGYTSVLAAHVKYGQGSGSVWMSNLACTGSENSISECSHIGWGETTCSHSQDAGVTCGRKCPLDCHLGVHPGQLYVVLVTSSLFYCGLTV